MRPHCCLLVVQRLSRVILMGDTLGLVLRDGVFVHDRRRVLPHCLYCLQEDAFRYHVEEKVIYSTCVWPELKASYILMHCRKVSPSRFALCRVSVPTWCNHVLAWCLSAGALFRFGRKMSSYSNRSGAPVRTHYTRAPSMQACHTLCVCIHSSTS